MEALRQTAWKQPELGDVPEPEAGPGEVVIRVAGADAAGLDGRAVIVPG